MHVKWIGENELQIQFDWCTRKYWLFGKKTYHRETYRGEGPLWWHVEKERPVHWRQAKSFQTIWENEFRKRRREEYERMWAEEVVALEPNG